MRAFVALPCPDTWERPLTELQAQIPVGRAVPEENLHITLAFLGDVDMGALEELHDLLEGARLSQAPLAPAGLAQLGDRALALDLEANTSLSMLQGAVTRAVRSAGIALDRRRFRPHVTLIRFSRLTPGGRSALETAIGRVEMPAITPHLADLATLYRSDLGPDGAIYEALADYPLR